MHKQITILAIAIIAASLISISAIPHEIDAQVSKKKDNKQDKGKKQQCNNVKVNVQVNGGEVNDTLVGTATLGSKSLTKTVTVENDTEATGIPFNFKKVSPCPELGSQIFGNVNGTGFSTELKSLKKPNKVTVDLP